MPLEKAPAVLENLLEAMLRFWDQSLLDDEVGGYALGHDVSGRPTGGDSRHLVSQARTAWFFARVARSPYGDEGHLRLCEHGIRFVTDRMWDPQHGGFYWEVGPDGPRDDRKHLYGQAFAILALSEAGVAAREPTTVALAGELARLVDSRAHDDAYGGYVESLAADWSPEPGGGMSALGQPTDAKTANTHLHLMEALTSLAHADPEAPVPRTRLPELVLAMSDLAIDRATPTYVHTHARDWSPLEPERRSSYGHDLEGVTLLMSACDAAGLPERMLTPLYTGLWDHALAHGFDRDRGGFYTSGPPGRAAERRDKVWWTQAEALLSALHMWRLTGDERYRQAFELTLGWIAEVQADLGRGDWHATIDRNGAASGDKSGAWKDPYHQGRAVLDCLELLSASDQ